MLSSVFKPSSDRLVHPVARRLAAWGISPTMLTLAGVVGVAGSCTFLLITRRLLVFCVLALTASLFDALDGAVARAGGRVTKTGAYLDALCDRAGESMIVISVAWVTGEWLLSMLFAVGAWFVSYAKARAAMEAPVSNLEWPDLMERPERGLVYLAGLAASAVIAWKPCGQNLFWWTLAVLTALVYLTAMQRAARAIRLIRARG